MKQLLKVVGIIESLALAVSVVLMFMGYDLSKFIIAFLVVTFYLSKINLEKQNTINNGFMRLFDTVKAVIDRIDNEEIKKAKKVARNLN